MRRRALLAALVIGCVVLPAAAEFYKLENVKRVEKDLYRDGNLYIVTKFCFHYTYGEEAVLKLEGKYGANSIIWDDSSTCQVANVFSK